MRKLQYIQEVLGTKMLKFKVRTLKRIVKVQNLETAKTIGILFDAKNQEDHKRVVSFANTLCNEYSMKVEVLAYINKKELQTSFEYESNFTYISEENFNWRGKAITDTISKFLDQNFNIFIDLTIENTYAFEYIASLSKANFRVGKFSEDKMPYDFMIDIKNDKSMDYFIKQILIYLSMIKVSK